MNSSEMLDQDNNSFCDATVIEAVLRGESHLFNAIVRRYRSALLRLAQSRLCDRELAEDVTQETFLCAFKSLHTYDSRYSFRTWLWTILLNQCRRHAVRRQRHKNVHLSLFNTHLLGGLGPNLRDIEGTEPSPQFYLENKEKTLLLEAALKQIKDVQADALRLRFFGGLKFREIANVMNCSLGTAKNRVRAGLINLSQTLEDLTSKSYSSADSPAVGKKLP